MGSLTGLEAYEWVYTIISYCLFLLYILVIITLIKFRKTELSSPFYTLFLFLSFCDIFRALQWHVTIDISRWNLFPTFYKGLKGMATVMFMGIGFGIGLSRVLNVVIGINRLTALTWPLLYDLWWSGKKPLWSFVASVFIAVILNSHYFFMSVLYGNRYIPTRNGTSLVFLINKPTKPHYSMWFTTNVVQAALAIPIYIGLYGTMFYIAYKKTKKVTPISGSGTNAKNAAASLQAKYRSELKLAFSMFFLCLFQLAFSVHMIIPVFFLQEFVLADTYLYYVRLSTIVQLDSLINPVLLLAMSKNMRQCLKNIFK